MVRQFMNGFVLYSFKFSSANINIKKVLTDQIAISIPVSVPFHTGQLLFLLKMAYTFVKGLQRF